MLDFIILEDKEKHKHPIFEFIQLSVALVEQKRYTVKIPSNFSEGIVLFICLCGCFWAKKFILFWGKVRIVPTFAGIALRYGEKFAGYTIYCVFAWEKIVRRTKK